MLKIITYLHDYISLGRLWSENLNGLHIHSRFREELVLCGSRKYPYPPPRKVAGISEGEGGSKREISEGSGGSR